MKRTLVRMAANGITLKPVRMGDLVASGAKSTATLPTAKYVPPSKRQGPHQEPDSTTVEVVMSEEHFPTLGSTPKKTPVWGKNAVNSSFTEPKVTEPKVTEPKVTEPKTTVPSLSDKIKEKIRLDTIAEEERVRGGETDVWKMTPAQLEAEGWISLPLKSAKMCNVSYSL